MVATLAAVCSAACSSAGRHDKIYGAQSVQLGQSVAVLGWNMSVSNLRWNADYVLVDVDAARATWRHRTPNPRTSGSGSTVRWRTRWSPPASAAARARKTLWCNHCRRRRRIGSAARYAWGR
ncbi:hypothetical protein I553_1806 [Mycobacterium xenopi 4042]|uniref:Uncharacterized protein n=1 Tax=Mycobacterium xenopi 4042 TaxID=1299334 RepID=X8DLM3_MYCXE|nr:hypothetical protein I553_1806 [Mycobacterium xenopi 4042]